MSFDDLWGQVRGDATARVSGGGPAPAPPEPALAPDAVEEAREAVLERLARFRSLAVLVPLDEAGGLWTEDLGGISWICAFSGEPELARFAEARGDGEREWPYRRVLGARLLDEVVPAVEFPCGVALDAAGPDGAVFPPVRGIVPDRAAVDVENAGGGAR
ncbi:hypothetical protein ABT160_33710 [Streptomyces sp. NPDC001941]|uniref:hypothetical protein n=1 Tax=Streptomyces sp. NPDC001941 TaxID=3154659 RepID=UPI0033255C71